MRTRNLLIILSLMVLSIACKKTENDSHSTFKAKKDGIRWITTSNDATLNLKNNTFLVIGRKEDPKYNQEESLLLSFSLTDGSKLKMIENFTARWIYVVGGDAISDQYQIDTSFNNTILITALDTLNKTISGTFKVKLVRDKFYPEPAEMSFTDGTFDLLYEESGSY